MRKYNHHQEGMSLVELMLVLVIGSSIVMLGIKHYKTLRTDGDSRQVMYNVDKIFQAASEYYQANCRRQVDPTTDTVVAGTGTLDPDSSPAPTNPYPITVASLTTDGYLTGTLPLSPLVDDDGPYDGYYVQFNRVSPDADRTTTAYSGETVKLGRIIVWRVQVAVKLRDENKAETFKRLLGADCRSSADGSGTITPCAQGSSGKYLVWERLPSFAMPNSNSNYWMTNAANKQFNSLYQTYPVIYLSGVPEATYPQQNYLCGN